MRVVRWQLSVDSTVNSCHLKDVSWELSDDSCQFKIDSCHLKDVSWQLSVDSGQLPVFSCQLSVVSWQMSVYSCQLTARSCYLSVSNNFSDIQHDISPECMSTQIDIFRLKEIFKILYLKLSFNLQVKQTNLLSDISNKLVI